jgi:Guanosine polyphosphate pyrophosphohydrolases/synthetases
MDDVSKAEFVATVAHDAVGQKRKFTNEPYWTHPQKVAEQVSRRMSDYFSVYDKDIVAAAWLHDVVEDTKLTNEWIVQEFGLIIAELVFDVTEQNVHGSSSQNALHEILRLSKVGVESQFLKLCDIYCNVSDICVESGDGFVNAWVPTKIATVLVISETSPMFEGFGKDILDVIETKITSFYPHLDYGKLFKEATSRLEKAKRLS